MRSNEPTNRVRAAALAASITLALTACNGSSEPSSAPAPGASTGSSHAEVPDGPPPMGHADDNTASLGLPNERLVADGKVVAGGQPSPEALRRAKSRGVTAVVNLRTPAEPGQDGEEELLRQLGIRYERIPMAGAQGLTEENARQLGRILSEAQGPVLVHCASGNRVGGLYALTRFLVDGVPRAQAIQEGRNAGMRSIGSAVEAWMNRYCEEHPDHGGCR